MGPEGLHLVRETSDDQGEWGVYEHIHPLASPDGLVISESIRLFPNRQVPDAQPSSRGIGWDATTAWLIEGQFWLPSGALQVLLSPDADTDGESPDILYLLTIAQSGDLTFRWDDRIGHAGGNTVPNLIRTNRWHHLALQKNANDSNVRVYCDGNLVLTEDVTYPLACFDLVKFGVAGGQPRVREFNIRASSPLPTIPFSPGVVSYATVLGDTQSRWNSYML